jgi:hypothetical protein
MKIGWMSERVSTTDWLEGIGELMYGSTWAETSLMLSYVELPGVYIQPDKSFVFTLDHIESQIVKNTSNSLTVKFSNPTKAMAIVKVFSETSKKALLPLGENSQYNGLIINLQPGETREMKFRK